jgi:hypothetical protein
MSPKTKDRQLGACVAACAVCCAPPLLALPGLAGPSLAATIATDAFAGLAFAVIGLAIGLVIGFPPAYAPQQSHTDG